MKEKWYEREKRRLGKNPLDVIRGNRRALVFSLVGSKCLFCGYDKYLGNLVLHHVEPSSKEFYLSNKFFQKRLEELLPEIQKCVLCCHNCHGEIHAGLVDNVEEKYKIFLEALRVLAGKTWRDFELNWKDVKNLGVA